MSLHQKQIVSHIKLLLEIYYEIISDDTKVYDIISKCKLKYDTHYNAFLKKFFIFYKITLNYILQKSFKKNCCNLNSKLYCRVITI